MKLNKLTERTYKIAIETKAIKPTTNYSYFLDRLNQDIFKMGSSVDYIKTCKKNLYSNFEAVKDDLATTIIDCLNMAEHYKINIEEEIIKKIEINEQRAENNTDSGDAKNNN